MMRIPRLGAALALALALGACSTVSNINPFHHKAAPSTAAKGVRIPVIALNDQLKVSDTLQGQDFFLPPPAPQADWPLPGGNPNQSVEHVLAAPNFTIAWRRGIGDASSRTHEVTAPPIAAEGRVFVMDGAADVSAHDQVTGAQIWRTNVMPKSRRDHEAWGGGVAYADGKVFVSSGFREVVALDAATGKLIWRSAMEAPLHAAPTVSDGRVFVVDVDDELFAFDANTGIQDWTYQALTEPARMLAASSPAVDNETVVAAFASGELVALRAANGNELWNASLVARQPHQRPLGNPRHRRPAGDLSRATSLRSATPTCSPPSICAPARRAGPCRSRPSPRPGRRATWSMSSITPAR